MDTGEGSTGEGGHKLARHHQGVVTDGEAAAHVDLGHQGVSTSHAESITYRSRLRDVNRDHSAGQSCKYYTDKSMSNIEISLIESIRVECRISFNIWAC